MCVSNHLIYPWSAFWQLHLLEQSSGVTNIWKGSLYTNIMSQCPCMFYSFRSNIENMLLLVNYCNQLVLLVTPHVGPLRTYLFLVGQNPCEQLKISAIGALDLGNGSGRSNMCIYLPSFSFLKFISFSSSS